ncbi:DUF3489 domain-containing protein [Sphingomonas sp. RRHST34]|uniref:DUF3489 domain-containing protein n=1 Tax=Sphingomonas citri TaxID=2862499 RepID=A0ABS7BLQ0_9SPHN|nr:DUF3489 domain-containing protein [Sphingomonas citri]MBW6530531.1 DUF3489 domain-containing protein [Sphingomonas citri]
MPKLTDSHTLLLAHAAQRDSGSLFPLPEALAGTARTIKAIASLLRQGFVAEQETRVAAEIARQDDDRRLGVFITPAGLAAINAGGSSVASEPTSDADAAAPRTTKVSTVVALLERDEGATLPDLIAATGWLPHTTRAALTGLRKKGHVIERTRRDELTCYRIVRSA